MNGETFYSPRQSSRNYLGFRIPLRHASFALLEKTRRKNWLLRSFLHQFMRNLNSLGLETHSIRRLYNKALRIPEPVDAYKMNKERIFSLERRSTFNTLDQPWNLRLYNHKKAHQDYLRTKPINTHLYFLSSPPILFVSQ